MRLRPGTQHKYKGGGTMEQITTALLEHAIDGLCEQLLGYQQKADIAYVNDECKLTINLSLKFAPDPDKHGILIETNVGFVESKIKDRRQMVIDPNQLQLHFERGND
jgi:hypothetical protein